MKTTLLAAVCAVAGCATLPAGPPRVSPATNPEFVALVERDRLLTSLETAAIMEYTGPHGHLKVRERITVRRPASLRVEARSPLGVALIVAADATAVAIFDPSQDTIARGAATAATLSRVAQIPLAPEQAARLLLALPPDDALASAPPVATPAADGMTALAFTRPDGTREEIAFLDGQLALVRATTAAGSLVYEVRYSDYQDVGAMQFPHTIDARFAATATTVKLRYENPAIDGAIPDAAFILTPGPQTKELRFGRNAVPRQRRG